LDEIIKAIILRKKDLASKKIQSCVLI